VETGSGPGQDLKSLQVLTIKMRLLGLGLWLSGRTFALLMCEALGLIPQHHKNKQINKQKIK
jgi:hypothetical protein